MTALIVCRHGRTEWNDLGRYQGQTDVPLNESGRQQARFLAQTLRTEPISAVYSSDLSRCTETALEIARFHDLPVRRDPRLREINQGRWEGRTVTEIYERDHDLHRRWETDPLSVTLPGGESLADVRSRALAAVREIVLDQRDNLSCIVTHKVVMAVIRCEITGAPLDQALRRLPANGSFERLDLPTDLAAQRLWARTP